MRARTSMKLLCEGPVNLYLLCARESPICTNLRRAFTFRWAMALILAILAAIYMTVRGTIR